MRRTKAGGGAVPEVTVREQSLPGIGTLFELRVHTGDWVSVVFHRSRRRDVGVRQRDDDETVASVTLTEAEALALAAVLAGVLVDVESDGDSEPVRG